MPFYLTAARNGQHEDVIQRFDPRFWTVNFPRPMMASVVTTAPDALRVDCEFYHAGELAGLIWVSEDRHDHPLLAYRTRRDYAHGVLRFRWRSGGVIPLDQPNGPTLTIEGRDAAGAPRAWYVRLWNYAEGTPEDALITLRFSELESGYGLPGEPIHPGDIDRMFISLVPPGYVGGSTDPLPQRADGWAELTDITCWGEGAMLPVGDVIVPPHGLGMASAYDDTFDQTPARLVRQIEQLGYRDEAMREVIHYVGMSHFFRLEPGEGRLLAAADGALCGPARRWHAAYFTALAEAGLIPIISLSYELFADHCPTAWQQRAHDGAPARTGWEPPSALLSPATHRRWAGFRRWRANSWRWPRTRTCRSGSRLASRGGGSSRRPARSAAMTMPRAPRWPIRLPYPTCVRRSARRRPMCSTARARFSPPPPLRWRRSCATPPTARLRCCCLPSPPRCSTRRCPN